MERPQIEGYRKMVEYRFNYLTKKERNKMERMSKSQIYEAIDMMITKMMTPKEDNGKTKI